MDAKFLRMLADNIHSAAENAVSTADECATSGNGPGVLAFTITSLVGDMLSKAIAKTADQLAKEPA